ncbi:zinc finger protein 37-like isoform X1 [Stegastes partitus]|uniref:Zinc finger protein 37-like isoform X1 n=1 Tax=Stegastes partitus TaxID=144197 RepID=A0A9Y4KPM6_9TELE|nr:PREDICTED: zinc finger protein 37-like isoform X1 [Stegastes partitus]
MSSVRNLRELINERLTAAAEEIFAEFEKTIVQYEEEIDRQRGLLDNIWKPRITLHTTDFPQQSVCKEEEVLTDQQLSNQERNSSLDQEDPEPLQIKVGQQELCTTLNQNDSEPAQIKQGQEGPSTSLDQEDPEPPQVKECKSICEEISREVLQSVDADETFTESQKTIVQCEENNDRQHRLLDITLIPELKLHRIDFPQQHACNQEEFFADQQPCNQERNSILNQEDPVPPQIKEPQEEPCSSLNQEGPELPQVKQGQKASCTFLLLQCKSTCDEIAEEMLASAAAEETFTESKKTIVQCKEDSDHQHRLLDILWKPKITLHRIDFPHQRVCNKWDVSADKQLCNQDSNSSLNQEDPEPPQIKEGQEELCSSQEGEQFVLRLEASGESDNSETEPDSDQFREPESSVAESRAQRRKRHIDLESTRSAELKPKKRHLRGRSQNNMEENSHMSASHSDTDTETGRKPVKCDVCGKAFKYRSKMRYHRRSHTGEKPYACSTCGKKFTRMSSIKYHKRIHTGEKPYACEICDKRFRGTVDLITHMRTHTGEKLHSCKTCGKTFTQRGHLLCHIRIHTGEKPYSCETCGKKFIQCNHLLRHMRTHTGEKPFSCKTCGKSFNQTEILNVHMKTHTYQKPCICSICGKEFKATSALMRHMRTHAGESPYL